ncbi:hypothetical protein PSEUBRA_001034 [Kalmanozyma brasiliensis GHG001]|uniref:uncharacterized protein n=1 Tax=Kalmanozyma brasiliensis (strain GHG001) TaxID=1365824 RepID=UPI001CEA65AD|nr:uncharacterized protein PSEUBRA_001034 [Kalmanozyma brasiliensis GHG001]EST09431.2 hypothetical protein PSEUBRA_001034 [Kalmanozyma brasiliensis GHG001]
MATSPEPSLAGSPHGETRGVMSVPGDPKTIHAAQSGPRRISKRGPRASLLPLLAMLLCSFLTIISASSLPAATPALARRGIAAASKPINAVLPTSYPYEAQLSPRQLASANHVFNVRVSQPTMCQPMNITFDPSYGKPPYTVMISTEDYWPVTVSLTSSYDDATKDLWLYQYDVPMFAGGTKNPSMIVSVVDSTGAMSNSSSFVQAQSPGAGVTCAPFQYTPSFVFWTIGAPSMCQPYEIVWNGSYAPPMAALFLPEAAPPIYVPAPLAATTNMTWQVAMEGGTRFVMSLADSRQMNSNGGVSKLNIVALNEYVNDSCIGQSNYQHRVFAATSTASAATLYPDATSMVASLTTSGGMVATVTVIETIKNGRLVHGNGGGLGARFLILIIALLVGVGLVGAAAGYFCFRRRQRSKQNIRAWDLPDASAPFKASRNTPIAPGVFGRSDSRQESSASIVLGERDAGRAGAANYDPAALSSRPLTHAPSRSSLRSWTSGMYQERSANNYPMIDTASVGIAGLNNGHQTHNLTRRTLSDVSRDGWSPTDSISITRPFGSYLDEAERRDPGSRLQSRTGSPGVLSRGRSSDSISVKSMGVGPGPTYRPDAAYQAAYQDLIASQTPPVSGVDGSLPFGATQARAPLARTPGWAEVSGGADHPAHIVRHADAGLLLDDNDNGDELISLGTGRLMELPPQYDTIHPSTRTQQRSTNARTPSRNENPFASPPIRPRRSHAHGVGSVDISDPRNRRAEVHAADLVDENDDESAFWAH